MASHPEPDILEYEVKWALGSISMNKASGGDGISAELFQILKDDAVKVLYSICQQIWKTQQCPQTGKGQFSFPTERLHVHFSLSCMGGGNGNPLQWSCLEMVWVDSGSW